METPFKMFSHGSVDFVLLQGVNECMSLAELRLLVDELGGKLARKRKDGQYVSTSNAKRRKKIISMISKKARRAGNVHCVAMVHLIFFT